MLLLSPIRPIACSLNKERCRHRRGVSTLEWIGCLAAVGAGIWLGAMYVGFDLREVWNYGVRQVGFTSYELEVPETEENGDADDAATESDSSVGDDGPVRAVAQPTPSVDSGNRKQNTAPDKNQHQYRQEIDRLRDAVKRLEENSDRSTGASNTRSEEIAPAGAGDLPRNTVGHRNLAYWNKLNEIMAKEEQMRTVPAGGLTAGNAGTFLAGRSKASHYAAKAIRGLPTAGVNPAISDLARDIANWYTQGAELSERATRILTSGSASLRQGPMGKKWQADEKQHQNELLLINRRGDTLRGQLTNKYGLPFPDLR